MSLKEIFKLKSKTNRELIAKAKLREQEEIELKKELNNDQLTNSLIQIVQLSQLGTSNQMKYPKSTLERCFKGTVADCINLKAKYSANARPVMYRKTTQIKNEPIPKIHPFIKLIENPNDGNGTTKKTLLTKTIQNLEIYGDAYWRIQPGNMGLPNAIVFMPTRFVDIIYVNGTPDHYEYREDSISVTRYELNDVIHFSYSNPFHPYEGISNIQTGYMNIQIAIELTNYQLNFLSKGGIPPLVLETDKDLKQPQINNLLDIWNASHSGTDNAGNTVDILTNGLKANLLGQSNKDLDFIESAKFFDSKIMNHFGVHIGLVNAENVNKANVHGAIVIFNHIVINELLDNLSSTLSLYIANKYQSDNIFIKFELDMPNDPDQTRLDYKLQSDIATQIGNKYIQKKILDDFRNKCDDTALDDNLLKLDDNITVPRTSTDNAQSIN